MIWQRQNKGSIGKEAAGIINIQALLCSSPMASAVPVGHEQLAKPRVAAGGCWRRAVIGMWPT